MGFITTVFLSELATDFWVLVTSFICIFLVIQIYLPKTNTKRKWISLFIIEGFEHLILPVLMIIALLFTNSWISALLFHVILLSFLFLFIGFVVVKAKTKTDWIRISMIACFVYFFVFTYPYLIILIQITSKIPGWLIMILTVILFYLFYYFFKK